MRPLAGRCIGKSRHSAACAVLAAAGGEATNYLASDRAGAKRLIREVALTYGVRVRLRRTEFGVIVTPVATARHPSNPE